MHGEGKAADYDCITSLQSTKGSQKEQIDHIIYEVRLTW